MQNKSEEKQMDTGKIFFGIALIAFSVAMVINPASAAAGDNSCSVGNGNVYTTLSENYAGLSQNPDPAAHFTMPAFSRVSPGNLP
jgi:hypothetical protein